MLNASLSCQRFPKFKKYIYIYIFVAYRKKYIRLPLALYHRSFCEWHISDTHSEEMNKVFDSDVLVSASQYNCDMKIDVIVIFFYERKILWRKRKRKKKVIKLYFYLLTYTAIFEQWSKNGWIFQPFFDHCHSRKN